MLSLCAILAVCQSGLLKVLSALSSLRACHQSKIGIESDAIQKCITVALQFAPENYFFSGSRAGNGASSTAGRFVSNSPEQTIMHWKGKKKKIFLKIIKYFPKGLR